MTDFVSEKTASVSSDDFTVMKVRFSRQADILKG